MPPRGAPRRRLAGDTALLAAALAQAYCYGFIVGADVDDAWLKRALELERETGGRPLRTQPSFGSCRRALSASSLNCLGSGKRMPGSSPSLFPVEHLRSRDP